MHQFSDTKFLYLYVSLVILGNNTEFERAVRWLSDNLSFDVDVRTNLFEVSNSKASCEKFSLLDCRAPAFILQLSSEHVIYCENVNQFTSQVL